MITIDLHGQHVKQAMQLVKVHLLLGTYVPCKCLLGPPYFLRFSSLFQKKKKKKIALSGVLLLLLFFGFLQRFKFSGLSQDVGHMD